ncbi:MAG: DndE family protein [Acidimicrobiales bacterium]
MTTSVVEPALRATYHLAGADAQRLRRLTRQSSLEAENVLSRLAIVRSITVGPDGPYGDYEPSKTGRTKEIKGTVLLGRPRQAVLLLALLAKCAEKEFIDYRVEITKHWARGLRLLEDASSDGDVLHALAEQLAAHQPVQQPAAARRVRRSGLGDSLRDELAAAVGRRFPRWSTEVCRLVAMAARLDQSQLDAITERLAAQANHEKGGRGLTESAALRILQQQWGVNRLGLTATDRDVLAQLLSGGAVDRGDPSLPFLAALGLVTVGRGGPKPSPLGRRLGEEAIHP